MNKKKISSLIQKKWPWKRAHKSKRITKKTRRKEKSWNWRSCRSLRGMCVGEGGKKERHLMDSLFNFQIEWRTFTSCCKTPHSLTEIGQLEAGAISISSWILPSLHTPFRKNSFFFCCTVYRCCYCCCCCFVCTWGRNLTQIFHLKFVLFGFWVYFSQAPWNDLCFMPQSVCTSVCVGVDLYMCVCLSVLSLPTTTTSKVPLFPFLVCPFLTFELMNALFKFSAKGACNCVYVCVCVQSVLTPLFRCDCRRLTWKC